MYVKYKKNKKLFICKNKNVYYIIIMIIIIIIVYILYLSHYQQMS